MQFIVDLKMMRQQQQQYQQQQHQQQQQQPQAKHKNAAVTFLMSCHGVRRVITLFFS
jgi:hypothetical protein